MHDTKHGIRYERILGAFLSICGKSLREELERQSRLVQILGMVAEKVKQTSGSARQVGDVITLCVNVNESTVAFINCTVIFHM